MTNKRLIAREIIIEPVVEQQQPLSIPQRPPSGWDALRAEIRPTIYWGAVAVGIFLLAELVVHLFIQPGVEARAQARAAHAVEATHER